MRLAVHIAGLLVLGAPIFSATLEKLSVEQMSQQSTAIVRGRITGCSGEMRGPVIYTRCAVAVTETWKGTPAQKIQFVVPGGTFQGLSQTFSGSPKFNPDEQFVLFLWVGRSGIPQIIGLSQGVFSVSTSDKGEVTVKKEATSELMLDAVGNQVRDEAASLSVAELRSRVREALGRAR
jgi:hypothetical protein